MRAVTVRISSVQYFFKIVPAITGSLDPHIIATVKLLISVFKKTSGIFIGSY